MTEFTEEPEFNYPELEIVRVLVTDGIAGSLDMVYEWPATWFFDLSELRPIRIEPIPFLGYFRTRQSPNLFTTEILTDNHDLIGKADAMKDFWGKLLCLSGDIGSPQSACLVGPSTTTNCHVMVQQFTTSKPPIPLLEPTKASLGNDETNDLMHRRTRQKTEFRGMPGTATIEPWEQWLLMQPPAFDNTLTLKQRFNRELKASNKFDTPSCAVGSALVGAAVVSSWASTVSLLQSSRNGDNVLLNCLPMLLSALISFWLPSYVFIISSFRMRNSSNCTTLLHFVRMAGCLLVWAALLDSTFGQIIMCLTARACPLLRVASFLCLIFAMVLFSIADRKPKTGVFSRESMFISHPCDAEAIEDHQSDRITTTLELWQCLLPLYRKRHSIMSWTIRGSRFAISW